MNAHPEAVDLIVEGSRMSPEEVAVAELACAEGTAEAQQRVQLLGYYVTRADAESRAARVRHVLWVVRHFPHTDIPATLLLVNRRAEPAHWEAVRQAWFDALAETPLNTSILWNVASWLIPEDPDGAEQLLQNGERLEPEESRWARMLAMVETARARREPSLAKEHWAEALAHHERSLRLTQQAYSRFVQLPDALRAAVGAEQFERASAMAGELLDMANQFPGDWNRGNAVHRGHIALGHVALARGDTHAAVEHLLLAACTEGSPQLGSFGPDFELAGRLLARGDREPVVKYLELCERFWDLGLDRLRQARSALEQGLPSELVPSVQ